MSHLLPYVYQQRRSRSCFLALPLVLSGILASRRVHSFSLCALLHPGVAPAPQALGQDSPAIPLRKERSPPGYGRVASSSCSIISIAFSSASRAKHPHAQAFALRRSIAACHGTSCPLPLLPAIVSLTRQSTTAHSYPSFTSLLLLSPTPSPPRSFHHCADLLTAPFNQGPTLKTLWRPSSCSI